MAASGGRPADLSGREPCELRKARGVFLRGSSDRHHRLVACDFPLEMQLPLEPPDRRVPACNHANEQLHGLHDVVAALYVRPFVNDDSVEVRVIEMVEEWPCNRDQGGCATQHRGGPHAVRQHKSRPATRRAHAGPVGQSRFELRWKHSAGCFRPAERGGRHHGADALYGDPDRPHPERNGRRCPPVVGHRHDRNACRRDAAGRFRRSRGPDKRYRRQGEHGGAGGPRRAVPRPRTRQRDHPEGTGGRERDHSALPQPIQRHVHAILLMRSRSASSAASTLPDRCLHPRAHSARGARASRGTAAPPDASTPAGEPDAHRRSGGR